MGCDIHTIAQVKKNGKWVTVAANIGDEDRSYNSFAVLANVRNGVGFAGLTTGEGWKPISQPRGLPSDIVFTEDYSVIVPEYEEYGERTKLKWLGEHSHSYLYLFEMENYLEEIKDKKYTSRRVTDKESYIRYKETGDFPTHLSGGVWGKDLITIEEHLITPEEEYTHVSFEYQLPCHEVLRYFVKAVKELQEIAKNHEVNSAEIRMVFGFDS